MNDLISRQAAITAIQNAYCDTEGGEDKCAVWKNVGLTNALHIMQDLPSAQLDVPDTNVGGNLIDREMALDVLHGYFDGMLETDTVCPKDLYNEIEALPSAQPERKKGHWIEVNDNYNRISGRCSVCGWESHMYEDDVVGMDFCPNCGARLDEKGGEVWSK